MSKAPAGGPSPVMKRTLLSVPDIHCSSCVSFIEDLLSNLNPRPLSVAVSINNRTVTIEHPLTLSVDTISNALDTAGYNVERVLTGDEEAGRPSTTKNPGFFSRLSRGFGASTKTSTNSNERRRIHKEHCKQCREGSSPSLGSEEGQSSEGGDMPGEKSVMVVVDDSSGTPPLFRAVLTITGMSCSSCVGKITSSLEEKPWTRSVGVNLLTHTATVEFHDKSHADDLVDIIEELGFEAAVAQIEEVPSSSNTPGQTQAAAAATDQWKATLSITGMTCSSCVGTITRALEGQPWMRSIDVNLVTHSAIAVFDNRAHLQDILSGIEDLGFEAGLIDMVDMGKSQEEDAHRTVSLKIEGMTAGQGPGLVMEALGSFGDRLSIQKKPTLEDPITTFSYLPEVPDFTVRAISSAVDAADSGFKVTIYHPPTVEERAQQLHKRTMRRIFYRVLLSFLVAIPSLVIGIVYMMIVPPSTPGHHYLMERFSGVSRAEWALLALATPVYFFAGDIFHRRTLKKIYTLWRPGSRVPMVTRFCRFGSMDMLISFATTIAYFGSITEISIAAALPDREHSGGSETYFDAVVFLILFLLIGRLIEEYSKAKTSEAVTKLGNLRPKDALLVVTDGRTGASVGQPTQTVPVDMLEAGDVVRVVHGGSPPWDGILLDGQAEFIESSLTGESRPVKKQIGDVIYAGTVNKGGGPVTMRTSGSPGDSLLDRIIKVVREGQARRAPIERVADTITGYFVPVVTLLAISTWLIWLALGETGGLPADYLDVTVGGWPFWSLQFAIAVFVIACPCGIGLAAPTALFVGGGLAAKHGILAKGGGEAFQEASHLDIVVFDKTGTLTEGGEPKLTDHKFLYVDSDKDGEKGSATSAKWDRKMVIGSLAELEANSSHPIAKAVVAFCRLRDLYEVKTINIEEIPGKGMKGSFSSGATSDAEDDEKKDDAPAIEMLAGNEALMNDHGVVFSEESIDDLNTWKEQAKYVVLAAARHIVSDGSDSPSWTPIAIFATSDPPRPESAPVVQALRRKGMDVWMISGDNAKTAAAVGRMVDIPAERIIAGVLPEQKADKIKYLQQSQVRATSRLRSLFSCGAAKNTVRRPTVAMVGDGVNDAPALTVADVGVAIGSGSDVAVSAADFVLVNPSLATLLTLTRLSRVVFRRVKFNFAWATIYNAIALPVAAGVLFPVETNGQPTRLDPVWAALAMALSSVSVVCSSLLLKSRLPLVGFRDNKDVLLKKK